jgi:hypothetical protein
MERCEVWIEAEQGIPSAWDPHDSNTDVIVTRADGTRWIASFFSYANIASLVAHWKRTGEYLQGAYFWASDLILIEDVTRSRIEEVIAHLLTTGEFECVFRRQEDESRGTGSGERP